MNLKYELKIIFIALTLLLFNIYAEAQCNLKPISLQERTQQSSLIVEGMVMDQRSLWDDLHQNIYTIYTVDVLSVFKGELQDTIVYVVAQGGVVGTDLHVTTHSLELNNGKTGVFSLIPTNEPITTTYPLYETYAGTQGFIKYEKSSHKAYGVFDKYSNIETELYGKIKQHTHREPVRKKSVSWHKVNDHNYSLRKDILKQQEDHHDDGEWHTDSDDRLADGDELSSTSASAISVGATISSFSPTTIQAGAFVQLTINGTGFGTTQGSSYVLFANADDGGSTFFAPIASHYISWSDTKIVVEVPNDAGTGKVKVSDGTNTATSLTNLTVEYNIQNVNSSASGTNLDYRPNFVNMNTTGGYTFQMYTGFDANTAAKTDFQNLVYQWRCATGINWIFGSTTTTNTTADDGINLVRFDSGSELSSGTLGLATSRYSGCISGTTVKWYLREVDVQVDDGTNFFYGSTGSPSGSQYDFYTVMLHEMGHAHQLGHVIDATKVMHYNLGAGTQKRSISTAELTGASWQLAQSIAAGTVCSKTVHIDYSCSPTVTLSVGTSSILETSGSTTVTATLSKRNFSDVTVTIGLSGTATTTADYTLSTTITVPAGSLSASVTLASVSDTKYEGNETVIIDITGVTNGTENSIQQQTVTITDDDTAPTVTLTVGTASITETSGSTTVTVTLSAVSGLTTTVTLTLTGTATVTTDYTLSTTISIPAGSSSASVTLASVSDTKYEGSETVIIDITGVTNGTESGTQQQTVTITDDDTAPTVTLTTGGTTIAEAGGTTTVTATLSAASGLVTTVTIGFTGTATVTTDYTLSTTISIPAGSTSASVTLTAVTDALYEGNETVIIDVTGVTNGTENSTQQRTVTITDDDTAPTVTLTTGGTTIAEAGGTTTVTATLSAASGLVTTLTIGFTGTATVTTDYTLSTTISIPAGSTSASVTLTGVTDALYEGNETVIIDVTGVTNGTENSTQQRTVTITDDDTAPTVTLTTGGTTIAEASGTTTVTATLSAASGLATTVTIGFSGTGTVTTDYTLSTTISIPAGSTSASVTLTAVTDALYEGNETVIIDVTGVTNGTENSTQQRTVTITDDDTAPTVTLTTGGTTIAEAGGTTTVTATLSAASGLVTTVTIGFTGTATVTTDYTLSTTISIPAGSTSASVTLTAVTDALYEGNETVIIDVTGVTNGTESSTQQRTVTITDDETVPAVTISAASLTVTENGGTVSLTATISGVSALPTVVNLSFSGSATTTTDYTISATITIPAGSTSASITLTSATDVLIEGDETVIIDIASVTNGTESGVQQNTITIIDNPLPFVTLSVGATSVMETSGSTTVTATLSSVYLADVTVNLSLGGMATITNDYTLPISIVIPTGTTSASVTLASVSDALYEGNETVVIDINSITNGIESGSQQQTVTITDDDNAPEVTLSTGAASVMETLGTTSITATLSAVSGLTTTVNLSFGGTASSVNDYALATSIVIPAGSTSASVSLTSVTDILYEGDETVVIDISSVTNGSETDSQQQIVSIIDDDSAPIVTLSTSVSSLAETSGSGSITATLSAISGLPTTVNISTTGTATQSDDYTLGSSIIIPAGSASASVTISSVSDVLYEGNETVTINITSITNGAESGVQQQTVTIMDDDNAPTVVLTTGASSIAEASGSTSITATLSAISGLPTTVNILATGTAAQPADYTLFSSIVIPAGSTSASIMLSSVNDILYESNETIMIDIASVTNGTESGVQQQIVTITEDDAAPTVILNASELSVTENGGTSSITATLSAVAGITITIDLTYSGMATIGTDYSAVAQIVIPAGTTSGSLILTSLDDVLDDDNETIIVDISSVTNGTENLTQQLTITIADDENPEMNIRVATVSYANNDSYNYGNVTVGSSSTVQFIVENLGLGQLNLTNANLVTLSGVNALDYTLDKSSLSSSIAPGANSTFSITFNSSCGNARTAQFTINNDDADETTYVVSLTALPIETIAPLPDLAILSDITSQCAVTLTAPTATDNCNGTITATTTDPFTYTQIGSYTVTWIYTDLSGNSTTQTQTVTIEEDVTAPQISCPSNIVSDDPTVVYSIPVATDNCSVTLLTRTAGLESGSVFPHGITTITYTATDESGNNVDCSFTVTIHEEITSTLESMEVMFKMYPNPGIDHVILENITNTEMVNVYDNRGILMMSKSNPTSKEEINLTGWAQGIYMVQLISGNKVSTHKLEIVK